MGHTRMGRLPATRKWLHVINLIGGGADVHDVAAATSAAAERSLARASHDPGLRHAVWLLTQIPLAARAEDFVARLRGLGLDVGGAPTLAEICAAMALALDRVRRLSGRRSDLGEIAQLSAVESLNAIAGRIMPGLFGSSHEAEDTHTVLKGLATMKQFSVLARDFFARLLRRCLDYFLSRELPNHIGVNARFHALREHRDFEEALEAHCRETTLIIRDYAGEWFSKANYEGGIDERRAGDFASFAFKKLRDELRVRGEAHA